MFDTANYELMPNRSFRAMFDTASYELMSNKSFRAALLLRD